MLARDALLERREQGLGAVDRNREADADVAFDRALDRVIDADQLAASVQHRTTRIPRVDRRIDLNHSRQRTAGGSGAGAVPTLTAPRRVPPLHTDPRSDGTR